MMVPVKLILNNLSFTSYLKIFFGGLVILSLIYFAVTSLLTDDQYDVNTRLFENNAANIQYVDIFHEINSDNKYPTNHSIPSFILLGPPKVGTRSFINRLEQSWSDFIGFGPEHYHFTGANKWTCLPKENKWNITDYILWTKNYQQNKSNLYDFIPFIISSNQDRKCTKTGMILSWNHKMHKLDISDCMNNNEKCSYYFIEKAPTYSRHPFAAILIANQIPNTKLLIIVREPYAQSWSYCWHFSKKTCNNDDMMKSIYLKHSDSINALNDICTDINYKWYDTLNDTDHYELFINDYKRLIAKYFYLKYVSPQNIEPHIRRNALIWVPFQFPTILIWLFAIEEYHGINNIEWDQFRLIQFDFLWNNVDETMNIMRCWITKECVKDFENNKRWNVTTNKNQTHANHKAVGSASIGIRHLLRNYYRPCYTSLINLLYDRPDLLLGRWIQWIDSNGDHFP